MKGGIYPTKYGWQLRFGKLTKRFKKHELEKAEYVLSGLRYETYRGTFDIRDYQQSNPLGFENLVEKFLYSKRNTKEAYRKYRQMLNHAIQVWGNQNIKEIGYANIEDLLLKLEDQGLSSKYRHDLNMCLKMLWKWLANRKEIRIDQIPTFPKFKVSMKFRKVLTKDDQQRVLSQIYNMTWSFNPRIYIGCLFLSTYINTRPIELINIKEKDIDLKNERILLSNPKEFDPKFLYLIREDVRLLEQLPNTFPEMYFFRHIRGNGKARPGQRFGKDYLYKKWKDACEILGIRGVSLYPGTRHTTAIAMRQNQSPESIKRAMGTRSNKAFERYLQITGGELRGLYQDTRTDNELITKIIPFKKT